MCQHSTARLVSDIVTKKDVQVKSSKIVAGLEAEKTNELFQAIAFAVENQLDSSEAVKTVKHGDQNGTEPKAKTKDKVKDKPTAIKPTKPTAPTRDPTPTKPEKKKAITTQRSTEKKISSKEKVKEISTSKSRVTEAKDSKKIRKTASKEKETLRKVNSDVVTNGSLESQSSIHSLPHQGSIEKVEEPPVVDQKPVKVEELTNGSEDVVKVNGDAHHEPEQEKEAHVEVTPKPQDELAAIIDEEAEFRRKEKSHKKLSAKHRQKSVEDVPQAEPIEVNQKVEQPERFQSSFKREAFDRPRTSLRPPSARPASSRPAAPRRRDKNIEIVLQPEETMTLGDISVKMENFSKELEDDGENLVIIEDSSVISDSFMNERLSMNKGDLKNEAEQGKLVQQILETEKNFEGALGTENKKKTEIVSCL